MSEVERLVAEIRRAQDAADTAWAEAEAAGAAYDRAHRVAYDAHHAVAEAKRALEMHVTGIDPCDPPVAVLRRDHALRRSTPR